MQTSLGFGGLVGTLLGGHWGQVLYNANRMWLPLFMGAAAIAGVLPFLVLLNLPTGDPPGEKSGEKSGGVLGGGASFGLLAA